MNATTWIVAILAPRFCAFSFHFIEVHLTAKPYRIFPAGRSSGREHFSFTRTHPLGKQIVQENINDGSRDRRSDQCVCDYYDRLPDRFLAEQAVHSVINKIVKQTRSRYDGYAEQKVVHIDAPGKLRNHICNKGFRESIG